ncbi:fibronectin type III-like domain-contianing protein [Nesterenkonia sp. PF2B19]|uniref:fibronectin type III-like domain-contianing protein n=1 Tax=Nesterenkonia sp. PF2B19 TaxID=1881858 RepID=UPI00301526E6
MQTTVTNVGERAGHEVVQVYVGRPGSAVTRAPRELKAFAAVELAAGESRTVELTVAREDLAHWDVRLDGWVVEGGEHVVAVGASSRDLRLQASAEVPGDEVARPLTEDSTLGDALAHPVVSGSPRRRGGRPRRRRGRRRCRRRVQRRRAAEDDGVLPAGPDQRLPWRRPRP